MFKTKSEMEHSSVDLVTPEQAYSDLEKYKYEGQRELSKTFIHFLVSQIKKENFVQGTSVHYGKLNGHKYLVDGQHRYWAVVDANQSQRFTTVIHDVEDQDELASLYVHLDQGRSRTFAHTTGAWNLQERTALNKTQINQVYSATKMIVTGYGYGTARSKIDNETMKDAVLYWTPYAKMFYAAIHRGDQVAVVRMKKGSIMAIALLTFKHQPLKANDFWHQVAYDDGLTKDDPRKTLQKFVVQHTVVGGYYQRRKITNRQFGLATARTWKAYYEGMSLSKIQIPNPLGVITVEGTPFEA